MEKLYNGIVLPEVWPPDYSIEEYFDGKKAPYLENPPEVIDITVGRQLFVDDFLIEESSLCPEYHKAKKYEGNPVLKPETAWETDEGMPCAVPKSGGVWYDEKENKFKMWYEAGWLNHMAYAESRDGIHWERPMLDIVEGTNKILAYDKDAARGSEECLRPDSCSVFIDNGAADRQESYKMLLRNPGGEMGAVLLTSADGIHWKTDHMTYPVGDRSTMFYNPFRKKWVFSIRKGYGRYLEEGFARIRRYEESSDFSRLGVNEENSVQWLTADKNNRANPYIGMKPHLYNVDAVAYESIMLGMFQVLYGPENDVCEKSCTPKITEIIPIYSRDGFHFTRPSEKSIVDAEMKEGSWDRGYIQSTGGICVINGDELWIYYIGFSGDKRFTSSVNLENGMYANGATGIARLRRDGFVSLNARDKGTLLTRRLVFHGKKYMFANFSGTLKVQLLDEDKALIAESREVCCDSTCQRIDFENFDIESVNNKTVRIRFILKEGKLWSFWLSDKENGESGGYTAGGRVNQ